MKISMAGQWTGYFEYGPEYGKKIEGERVLFRLFLEDRGFDQFEGKCVETEGVGSNFEPSYIKGFLNDEFISFIKEYSKNYEIDRFGKTTLQKKGQPPRLSYKGKYNAATKTFSGSWEIWANESLFGNGSFVDISTGIWEISKDDSV